MRPSDAPRLVVIHPPELAGKVLRLGRDRQSLGRGKAADLQLNDPHLSSFHAVLSHATGQTSVEDLGSRNGTMVNGERVQRPKVLRDGDVLQFGIVRARYEEPEATIVVPSARPAEQGPVRFDVERQSGDQINNVGRDQYHYVQKRDSFLREVAAARTRSLRMIWSSLALIFGGLIVYLWGGHLASESALTGFSGTMEDVRSGRMPSYDDLLREQASASFVMEIGLIIGVIGVMLLIVASIMHIIAAACGKKVDSDPRHSWNTPVERGRVGGHN
ncbi:FHA domain-containing protein [Herbidospora mongoliensis]|uniref:FHA domain-containing protein n=1 Tax=Herbidospora mongoliensis TaxID=688067 RepID=UPI000AD56B2B|nr:FHA domain-containing protein [Herbidospora mongoliensis]